jgi:hypothetical protein
MGIDTCRPIDLGTHVCQLYRGEDDLKEVTLPFLRDGLSNGEYCLYVADGISVDEWYRELQEYEVDVLTARETGALAIISSQAWRAMRQGGSSLAMARDILALMDEQLDTYPAVRIAGDVAWGAEPAMAADLVCHWEATANVVFEGLPIRVICQYDIERYEPAFIQAALRTHPVVLYKGRRVRNPHYEAQIILKQEPMLNGCSNDANALHDMLSQLRPRGQRTS